MARKFIEMPTTCIVGSGPSRREIPPFGEAIPLDEAEANDLLKRFPDAREVKPKRKSGGGSQKKGDETEKTGKQDDGQAGGTDGEGDGAADSPQG